MSVNIRETTAYVACCAWRSGFDSVLLAASLVILKASNRVKYSSNHQEMEISDWSWPCPFLPPKLLYLSTSHTHSRGKPLKSLGSSIDCCIKGTSLNGYRPKRVKWTSNYFSTLALYFCLGILAITGAFSHHARSPILPSTFSASPLQSQFWSRSCSPILTLISEQDGVERQFCLLVYCILILAAYHWFDFLRYINLVADMIST